MNKTFGSLKLRHRLYAGFAVIVLLLAGAIATMLWQVGRIDEVTNRIANLRTPTALTAERLTADVQGTLAALRGYLLTGNDAFKAERQGAWTDIDAAAGKMDSLSSNWTNPDNVKAWSAFKAGLDEFRGAQAKVESSADFTNIKPAVDLLVHEAAPRGKHLLEILVGAIGADGLRTGGMVDDQVGLLQSDTASGAAASAALLLTEWILLVVGVVIGGGIAFITARAISRPLVGMTDAMGKLADGSLDVAVPGKDRRDEIGDMAGAVEVFKQNAIRVRDLNGAEAERQAEAQRRAEAMHNLMSRLSSVVQAATDGNFNQRIELELTDSDLAAVANGVNELVGTVDRGLGETGGVLSSLAQTDLTRRVEGEYRGAFAQLKTDTNAVVENLAGVVGQLRGTSGALRTATREILSGANDLANRTTKQAAAVEETSAAMEQLAKTVNDNAKRAEQANTESQAVSVIGAEAGDVMKKSNNAMDRISASSGRISNIIGLIDDIAFQTNLLALNASVEAARAGEAGKGFAVVAIEVRRLAQSAAEASSEVKKLIDQSAGEVTEGSKLVADATRRLEAMLERLRGSTRLVEEIARATQDQSTAIGEVTIAVRMLDEMTQHNAALVEETNAAIEQTEAQAVELDQVVETFRVNAPSAPAKVTPSYKQRRSAA